MSPYPTPGAYQEAMLFPATAFADPELRRAQPEVQTWGLPRVITGAYAAVFPMQTRTRRMAVKCFLTEVPDQRTRYCAVTAHLQAHPLPCLINVDYQPRGVTVDGRMLPVLKMPWADGAPLNTFVAQHLNDPGVLHALAEAWREMLQTLDRHGYAHGDLQHGNVLVSLDQGHPRLTLVDYDTMHVPALKGRPTPEIGHRNYQHPDRREYDAANTRDRFAGLVVYTALQACIARPALWSRFDNGENLLFTAGDFFDPGASPLFQALSDVAALRQPLAALRTACVQEPDSVPPLWALHASVPKAFRSRKRQDTRRGVERRALPLLCLSLVVTAGAAAMGLPVAVAGLLLTALPAAGLCRAYARLPVVRRRRRLRQDLRHLAEVLDRLQRQQAHHARERRTFLERHETLKAERLATLRDQALKDCLKHHFVDEAGAFEGLSHKVVVRLKAAGIRNAYMATPDRLAGVKGIGEASRAGVARWRAALVEQYRDALPAHLGPSETRRLEHDIQRHLVAHDAEAARLKEKIDVQRRERAQTSACLAGLSPLSFSGYLRYVLHLSPPPPGLTETP